MTQDTLAVVAAGRLAKFRFILDRTDLVTLRTIHGGVMEFTPGEIEILLEDAAVVGKLGDPTRQPTYCDCGAFVSDPSGDAGCGNCGADYPPVDDPEPFSADNPPPFGWTDLGDSATRSSRRSRK